MLLRVELSVAIGGYGVAVVNNVVRVGAAGLGTVGSIRGAE
jgi:hypothetical protein